MPHGLSTKSAPTILLDLDGTLVDSAPSMTRGLNELAARRGAAPVAIADVRGWVSLGGEAMLRGTLGQAVDVARDLAEFRDILRNQVADAADLYPNVFETMSRMKADGARIGICTNKREDIAISYLKGVGLWPIVDAVIGGVDGRPLKPDPEPVRQLLECLGASAENVVFVGDSEVDAETSAATGIPFIFVTFGYPSGAPEAIRAAARIDDFSEMPGVVAMILNRATASIDLVRPAMPHGGEGNT